jgi:hypothetical protein
MDNYESRGSFKQSISMKWIKAESGTTYLCPAEALSGVSNLDENQLMSMCVNESENPQND